MTLDRRQLLHHCVAAVGLLAIGGCGRRDLGPFVDLLVETAKSRQSLTAVGNAYLADRPEVSLDQLAQRLAVDLDWREGEGPQAVAERLVGRNRADFTESKTVRVNGWLLSETEARWAALIALAPPAGR